MIDGIEVHCFAAALGDRYNTTALQRDRIITMLRRAGTAGVLSVELAAACDVPCITKRISELRRQGNDIKSTLQARRLPNGAVSGFACYVLHEDDNTQADLFA